ncbi:MAG: phage major capsid protein [Holosporaceae bacterium]|jgi:HK97 family phage major capsid protein|nr:phage major capsid protein [Holosporaceae bacterium]
MNKEIEEAVSELNDNVNRLVRDREDGRQSESARVGGALPLSGNPTEDGGVKSDFGNYIRKGSGAFLKKSLGDNDDSCGRYFIPEEIALRINKRLKLLSPMRAISRVITVSSNAVELLVDSQMPDAGWAAVNDEERKETDSPEIRKVHIPVHEVYAKPKISQKLLDDSQIDIEEWLTSKIAEKIAALENAAFINGDGKEKPQGFLQVESEKKETREAGKLQHFCSGADGKFLNNDAAADLLVDMVCSLKSIYVKRAKWIMSRSALAVIRKLKNKDGIYLWQPSLTEASPATLLGYPVIVDDDMPHLAEDKQSTPVAFGDFYSGYQIVDRQGLKILRDPYTSKPFVEFYATKRTGGGIADFDAIKLLKFSEKSE